MLIKFGSSNFNATTFLLFCAAASVIVLLALPFDFFHLDVEMVAGLFAATRVERDAAFVEVALRLVPWFVAFVILAIGGYLAVER